MLTRPSLTSLWAMHPCVSDTISLTQDLSSMRNATRLAKQRGAQEAYIFPNSWRSALIPFFARIPNRIAQRGHHRGILLTETTPSSARAGTAHQQWEYVDTLKLHDIAELPPPTLAVPDSCVQTLNAAMPLSPNLPWVAILPGAARGPSKQWPQEHFVAAAQQIAAAHPCRFVILGTPSEAALCEQIAGTLGEAAISLAGKTSLPELTAALARCSTVLCNDSGGMHLAAAAGVRVVAIFGITDPAKTGPLGCGHQLICADGVTASRDIARDSREAREALRSISPQRVAVAALTILNGVPSNSTPETDKH